MNKVRLKIEIEITATPTTSEERSNELVGVLSQTYENPQVNSVELIDFVEVKRNDTEEEHPDYSFGWKDSATDILEG